MYQLGSGNYLVLFDQNITQCAAVASVGDLGVGQSTSPVGGAVYTKPDATESLAPGDGLDVYTYNASGSAQTLPVNVAVFC